MSKLELKLFSSLAKIFPESTPESVTNKEIPAVLYGETISFQIAYKFKSDSSRSWANMEIKAPDCIDVSARRVRYVAGFIPAHFKTDEGYLSTSDGLFPDLLEPFDYKSLPLIPGIWQSIWISVKVTQNDITGTFPINIIIKEIDGNESADITVPIEIIPVKLPPLDIFHIRWFHTDCLANYYDVEVFSEKHWEIIENFICFAAEHGINTILTPIHTPPLDTAVGGERLTTQLIDITVHNGIYTFNFDKLERWISMCKRAGIERFEMAHLFTQWGAEHAPKITGTKDGEYTRLFGWKTDAVSDEYAGYLRQMLPALTAKLKELNVHENTIFHISDEPGQQHLESYRNARKIIAPFLDGFRIVDALTDIDFYKQGTVSIPIPAVDHITPFLEAEIPELWCYYCCVQSYEVPNLFFMQPSYRNRVLGVLLYKYNIAGFLHWGYNFYNSVHSVYPVDPFMTTDADGAFPSGDAFVVYPGADGKPLASLRLMVADEAFNDYRALKLLESMIGKEAVNALIDADLQTPLTFSCFPQNDEYILRLRRHINDKIRDEIDNI